MTGQSSKTRVGILISGRGSNMESLIAATMNDIYPAEVVFVGSDNPEAIGLRTAAGHGIATAAFARRDHADKAAHEAAFDAALRAAGVEIVCLAGFMRLLSGDFVSRWEGRIINIHPSLLPRHKGLDTHQRALDAGDAEHGCTVHHVTAGMDEGPVIAQRAIPVLGNDTAETLAARVLVEEHALYPEALRMVIEGRA